jgi:hypothetical protein
LKENALVGEIPIPERPTGRSPPKPLYVSFYIESTGDTENLEVCLNHTSEFLQLDRECCATLFGLGTIGTSTNMKASPDITLSEDEVSCNLLDGKCRSNLLFDWRSFHGIDLLS